MGQIALDQQRAFGVSCLRCGNSVLGFSNWERSSFEVARAPFPIVTSLHGSLAVRQRPTRLSWTACGNAIAPIDGRSE